MDQRPLGKTSERIPALGMGTWRMGAPRSPEEKAAQIESLKRGLELGLSLIDTAEIYADGGAERLVAQVIKAQRESILLATKIWPTNLHHDDVLAACNRSLERLGTTYVDLYQIHWPNAAVPIKETMSAMEELVRQGKVRHIGVSNFSVDQTREAQLALAKNELASNQVEYSLMNRSIESGLLQYCEKERITVIAYSPLGSGRIPPGTIPRAVLDRYKLTPAQVALNWVTFRQSVVAIPKAAKKEHMEENATSLSVRLSQDDYELISRHR